MGNMDGRAFALDSAKEKKQKHIFSEKNQHIDYWMSDRMREVESTR
jgi:hypothetical protein